jgi:hypothetical protein
MVTSASGPNLAARMASRLSQSIVKIGCAMQRALFGLFAFFYGCLHLVIYIWLDKFFDLSEMIKDIYKRPFITAGFTAFQMANRQTHRNFNELRRIPDRPKGLFLSGPIRR